MQLLVSSGIQFWSWKTEIFLAPVKENSIKNWLFCMQRYFENRLLKKPLCLCISVEFLGQEKTRRVILCLSSSGLPSLRHVRRRWWLSPWLCSVGTERMVQVGCCFTDRSYKSPLSFPTRHLIWRGLMRAWRHFLLCSSWVSWVTHKNVPQHLYFRYFLGLYNLLIE